MRGRLVNLRIDITFVKPSWARPLKGFRQRQKSELVPDSEEIPVLPSRDVRIWGNQQRQVTDQVDEGKNTISGAVYRRERLGGAHNLTVTRP